MTTNGSNGVSHGQEENGHMPYLSTEPTANANWQITLSGKVIAITGVCFLASC